MGKAPRGRRTARKAASERGTADPIVAPRNPGRDRQLQDIVDNLPGFIFRRVLRADGAVTYPYISPRLRQWCGMHPASTSRDERPLHAYLHVDDKQPFMSALEFSARELTPIELDVRLDAKESPPIWLRTVSHPRKLANGDIVWDGIALDSSKSKASETHLAYHDLLTGLPNRALFGDWLTHVLGRAKRAQPPLIVIALELISLADMRESSGFDTGDIAIRETAGRLQDAMQGGDTIAYTGGGGFLMVLMGNWEENDFTVPLLAILRQFEARLELEGQDFPLDILMGISVAPEDGDKAEVLIRNATTALNQVKDEPARRYQFYNAQMTERAVRRLSIESELRGAIEKQELVLFYQPQYHTRTLEIVGAEALMRWRHPEHGLIGPGEFIPVAEATGLIAPLGEFALRQACTQAHDWQRQGTVDIPMSVNLSAWQLTDENLGDNILGILSETGLAPDRLKLELTESSILRNVDTVTRTMTRLANAGVRFSVDDFGIEHSALSHLSRLPIETLKIDYSFVSLMTSDRVHAALVQAIISMTHAMSMTVVAEGVETRHQLTYLQAYQCDELQGFLLGRPMPVGKFEAHLKRRSRKRHEAPRGSQTARAKAV